MNNLSVLIIIKNEEIQIESYVKSVNFADEIIVILDKCTDGSERIVRRFTKKYFSEIGTLRGKEEILELINVLRNGFLKLMQMRSI